MTLIADLILRVAAQALHMALLVAAAPLVVGLLRTLTARLCGRVGPPLLQPWRDLRRLARKQPVVAAGASGLFLAAPAVGLALIGAAAALVPSFTLGMASAPFADLLVLAGLLMLARLVAALAGLDSGGPMGAPGASRAMVAAAAAEPALLLAIIALALLSGTTNLDLAIPALHGGLDGRGGARLLILAALGAVALADTGRMPLAGPAAEGHPTSVAEALELGYSGRHLALVRFADALRLLVWLTLIAALALPAGIAAAGAAPLWWLVGALVWAAKVVVLVVALALIEASLLRLELREVPAFLGVAALLALLAAALLAAGQGLA